MINGRVTRRDFSRLLASGALVAAAAKGAEPGETQSQHTQFAFGVIADAQYCDADPAGTRFYRASEQKLRECVQALNQEELAFTVHLGDFIDRDFASYDVMLPIYNGLRSPHYHVLGNHDFAVAAQKLDDVPSVLGLENRYDSFRCHKWRFITLDGNDLSVSARRKGSSEYAKAEAMLHSLKEKQAPNAQTWNGAAGEEQLSWLERQLHDADVAQERVIVFCHYPVFPENIHNLWNDSDVLRLLDAHRSVVAWMNGHNHAGNYGQKNGVHYVTFPGMVETERTTAFAVVHVQADSLRVVGHGRTPGRVLELAR